MPTLHAIVAVSENNVIADQGKLPWHLPDEYRWFKHKTIGGTLIMGRKTREAIGRALPKRRNLVLSRSQASFPDTECFTSLDALLAQLKPARTAWVVGGTEIYRQLLPQCTLLYLSRIKGTFSGDVFFPPFEELFTRDQIIHDNADFRIERWVNLQISIKPPQPETWPLNSPSS